MTIENGRLDLRRLLALLVGEKLFVRPDGSSGKTGDVDTYLKHFGPPKAA